VANGRYFGGGMKVAPDAALDDGWFDVITLGDFSFADLILRGLDIYSGKHLKNPKVTVQRARKIEALPLNGSGEVLLDVDGEAPGRLPATFELLVGALRVRAKA
jgi:diacylglycerol kinase family enzyme